VSHDPLRMFYSSGFEVGIAHNVWNSTGYGFPAFATRRLVSQKYNMDEKALTKVKDLTPNQAGKCLVKVVGLSEREKSRRIREARKLVGARSETKPERSSMTLWNVRSARSQGRDALDRQRLRHPRARHIAQRRKVRHDGEVADQTIETVKRPSTSARSNTNANPIRSAATRRTPRAHARPAVRVGTSVADAAKRGNRRFPTAKTAGGAGSEDRIVNFLPGRKAGFPF